MKDLAEVLEKLGLTGSARKVSRTADWDADIERREPTRFRFLGTWWTLKELDFRELARLGAVETYAGLDDVAATQKGLDLIGEMVTDPGAWKKKTAPPAKIAPSLVLGGIQWIMRKESGMALDISDSDDADPLVTPAASSPSAARSGRSSAGVSPRKRGSKTQ